MLTTELLSGNEFQQVAEIAQNYSDCSAVKKILLLGGGNINSTYLVDLDGEPARFAANKPRRSSPHLHWLPKIRFKLPGICRAFQRMLPLFPELCRQHRVRDMSPMRKAGVWRAQQYLEHTTTYMTAEEPWVLLRRRPMFSRISPRPFQPFPWKRLHRHCQVFMIFMAICRSMTVYV